MSDAVDTTPTDTDSCEHRPSAAILRCLERHVTLTVADLADELSVAGTTDPLTERSAEAVCERYMVLSCTQLPALAREGALAYDPDRDLVSLSGYGHDAVPALRPAGERHSTNRDEPA